MQAFSACAGRYTHSLQALAHVLLLMAQNPFHMLRFGGGHAQLLVTNSSTCSGATRTLMCQSQLPPVAFFVRSRIMT